MKLTMGDDAHIETGKPMPSFCPACQAIPRAGYCRLPGCPTAPRLPVTHDVKCVPPFFQEVWDGRKLFEVRKDDRDYQTGDTIIQHEYGPDSYPEYSGRKVIAEIGYVLRGYPAIADGHVVFSLLDLRRAELP